MPTESVQVGPQNEDSATGYIEVFTADTILLIPATMDASGIHISVPIRFVAKDMPKLATE